MWIIILDILVLSILDILRSVATQDHNTRVVPVADDGPGEIEIPVSILYPLCYIVCLLARVPPPSRSMRDPETRDCDRMSRAVALIALDRLPSCYL